MCACVCECVCVYVFDGFTSSVVRSTAAWRWWCIHGLCLRDSTNIHIHVMSYVTGHKITALRAAAAAADRTAVSHERMAHVL